MPPASRRTFLGGLVAVTTGLAAGCQGTQPEGTTTPSMEPPEGTTRTTTTSTETPVFEGLSTEGMSTACPKPDYASYAVTPVPYPTPAAPADRDSAVTFTTRIEAAYLDNWVVLRYDPLPTPTATPATPAPPDIEYPDVSASYATRIVLDETASGFLVHLQYERVVAGDVEGRYTVNYYLADGAVARAEAEGYVDPGPHPTEDGVLISC